MAKKKETGKLTKLHMLARIEQIKSDKQRIADDYDRFRIFHGNLKSVVMEFITKEFKKKDTLDEFGHRVLPINIMKKIITKLATMYTRSPIRKSENGNSSDDELIATYDENLDFNFIQKEANRYFKLWQRNLKEVFLTEEGIPAMRNLPAHTYKVFSSDPIQPYKIDEVVKIINLSDVDEDSVYEFWTDAEHVFCNGKGEKLKQYMEDGDTHNIGALPFVYLNESTYSAQPIGEDDVLKVAICIPILLSDASIAIKWQAFSMLYTINAEAGDIEFGPNKIAHLKQTATSDTPPEIGSLKPTLDTDKVLKLIESVISLLLSTKNLSVSSIGVRLENNPASGVSKILDLAESTEDRSDQESYFRRDEKATFDLLKKYMIPFWQKTRKLAPEFNKNFSPEFKLSIEFKQPLPVLDWEKEIDIAIKKLDAGLTTRRLELKRLNPEKSDQEIDDLLTEIDNEMLKLKELKGGQDGEDLSKTKEAEEENQEAVNG